MINVSETKYAVLSVMGSHAGESEAAIFSRKIKDIDSTGITYWLIKSYQAKPEMVQKICADAQAESEHVYCIFIEASTRKGAIPTKTVEYANGYSSDGKAWKPIPCGLSPVTGKIDRAAYALAFDKLELTSGVIDLWSYANYFNQSKPLKILQGASTLCAIGKDMNTHVDRIKSRARNIVALGRLCKPYCVYLK